MPLFRQLFDHETYTYSYLIADRIGGEAVLIDGVKEQVDNYLLLIEQLQLNLVVSMDTHVHADHITALGDLSDKTQCVTMMGEQSRAQCLSSTFKDGEIIHVGELAFKALYTPGHTDDSYSFLLNDCVFTGDTLLIRGTGRTDFQNGDPEQQYDSLFNKLLKLPEQTLVYPAHDYKGWLVSTIGEEKQCNPRLQVSTREEYVEIMNGLNLPNPKFMDIAVPANLRCGRTS